MSRARTPTAERAAPGGLASAGPPRPLLFTTGAKPRRTRPPPYSLIIYRRCARAGRAVINRAHRATDTSENSCAPEKRRRSVSGSEGGYRGRGANGYLLFSTRRHIRPVDRCTRILSRTRRSDSETHPRGPPITPDTTRVLVNLRRCALEFVDEFSTTI